MSNLQLQSQVLAGSLASSSNQSAPVENAVVLLRVSKTPIPHLKHFLQAARFSGAAKGDREHTRASVGLLELYLLRPRAARPVQAFPIRCFVTLSMVRMCALDIVFETRKARLHSAEIR